ncbi:protein of unknown function (plasmid) [Caballeronia sp. S22]
MYRATRSRRIELVVLRSHLRLGRGVSDSLSALGTFVFSRSSALGDRATARLLRTL